MPRVRHILFFLGCDIHKEIQKYEKILTPSALHTC